MSLLDRTQPPGSGEFRQFDFPEVQTEALPNGLDLKICVLPRLPIVSVNLFLRAGEGSLVEGGQNYSFKAIEIIKTSSRNNKIVSIEAVWTEKQFIDQFR